MPCDDCGGKFDLFSQSYFHGRGCPKREIGSMRQAARERFEEGRRDAFQSPASSDPSYRLGKEREEQERIDRLNPVVGGRRRRRR